MRRWAALLLVSVFGTLALLFGNLGWNAVPRNVCKWRIEDFCSDYGAYYWGFSVLSVLGLLVVISRLGKGV